MPRRRRTARRAVAGQSLAAGALVDRDLPHEQVVRALGAHVADDEADDAAVDDGDTAGPGEVTAVHEVGVRGVHVERLRVARDAPHLGGVPNLGFDDQRARRGLDIMDRGDLFSHRHMAPDVTEAL